jgi:hypothetical protein
MSTDQETNWNLVDFARQVAGMPASAPKASSDFAEPVRQDDTPPAMESNAVGDNPLSISDEQNAAAVKTPPAPLPKPGSFGKKQRRTRDEIAGMIETALRTITNYPKRGFVITVYGSNPWNAMLTIRPEAGAGIDRALWSSRVQEIGVQLRDDFDIIEETNPPKGDSRQEPAPVTDAPRKAIE